MALKYQAHINDMYEYIVNRVSINVPCENIVNEVIDRFTVLVWLPVPKKLLYNAVLMFVQIAYYAKTKQFPIQR